MAAFSSVSTTLQPELAIAIANTNTLLQPQLAGTPIEAAIPLEIRAYEPLLTFLSGTWSQYYTRLRLLDGTELPTVNFPSYNPGLGQLGQLSADLVGDQTDLFPRGQRVEVVYELMLPVVRDNDELRLSLAAGFEWIAYPFFQGVVTQGGSRQNSGAGTITHLEARSLGTALINNYLAVTAVPNSAGTELVTFDEPQQRFDAELNSCVIYLARRAGYGGLIFSQLPVRRLRKLQFTEQSAWSQIQEICSLFNCDAAIDDRFGILRITSVEREIADGNILEISNWDEQETEDSPSGPDFSEVMVTGVEPVAGGRRVLRSVTPTNALVPVPTGGQGTTLKTTIVTIARVFDGDRPIRTDTTTTITYPDFPDFDEEIRESTRFEYDDLGQKINEVKTRIEIGPYDELVPVTTDTQAALVFGGSSLENYWALSRGGVEPNFEPVNLDAIAFELRDDRIAAPAVFVKNEANSWQVGGRATQARSVAGLVRSSKSVGGKAKIIDNSDIKAIAAVEGTATLGFAVGGTATR
ncbi:MAG: hypothetical protein AAFY15_03840 [Cyanobacteria bacterium J06648_11]